MKLRLLLFAFLLFASCSIQERPLYRNDSLSDPEDYRLVRYDMSSQETVERFVREGKITPPVFTDFYPDRVYSYLTLDSIKTLAAANLRFVLVDQQMAFRDIDRGIRSRHKRAYRNLDDLKTGYKDNFLNEIYLRGIVRDFPDVAKLVVIGKTRQGRAIHALRLGQKSGEPKVPVLFYSSIHANEPATIEHVYDIIYHLLGDKSGSREILQKLDLWFVPLVNPDGSRYFWERSFTMGRKNGYSASGQDGITLGVDLNRNFPLKWGMGSEYSSFDPASVYYRGPYPASEPETRALIKLVREQRFLYIMIFHSQANSILYPYTIDTLQNPEPDYVKKLAKRLAGKVSSYRQDKPFLAKKNLYPVDGTDQDYYYHEFGANALLVEVSHLTPEYRFMEKILEGFRPMWREFLDECAWSDKVFLRIVDHKQRPLQAEIVINKILYKNGERRYSDGEGKFSMVSPWNSKFNIAIHKKGFKTVNITVKPDDKVRVIQMEKSN